MKKIILPNPAVFNRSNLITFSEEYLKMISLLKSMLIPERTIQLSFARVTDTGVHVPEINYGCFIKSVASDRFAIEYQPEGFEDLISKTIRLDNPLGEIPVLPAYRGVKIFNVGENFPEYASFIDEVRSELEHHVRKETGIRFTYKNDAGTYTLITGKLKEVNKSNFKTFDTLKLNIEGEKLLNRSFPNEEAFHRFISENGFLCRVEVDVQCEFQPVDEGETQFHFAWLRLKELA